MIKLVHASLRRAAVLPRSLRLRGRGALAFLCAAVLVPFAAIDATAGSFDGVTVVEISSETSRAILGTRAGEAPYLVTYVSEQGAYAALGDGDRRSCIAWATTEALGRDRIEFGVPATEQSVKGNFPPICQPFNVSLAGEQRVSIDAANPYHESGPLDPRAKRLHHTGEHDILARIPATPIDWDLPAFTAHDVRGVRLGPLPEVKARLGQEARMNVGSLSGTRAAKSFRVETADPVGSLDRVTIGGLLAATELSGWPSDVLFDATYQETFPQPVLADVFEEAVVERYGAPSRKAPGQSAGTIVMSWYLDLEGEQISASETAPTNCLATRERWIGLEDVAEAKGDIGPWGCLMIMTVTHDGVQGLVRRYDVRAVSGYVMAVNHFGARLEELRQRREALSDVQSYRPSLGGGSGDVEQRQAASARDDGAPDLDGITVVRLDQNGPTTAIASGEYLVIFASARGTYAAIVPRYGSHGGCKSLGVAGTFTGTKIAFGLQAEEPVRRIRLETYCPPFTVRLDSPDAVIVSGPEDNENREVVVAHIPLDPIDLRSAAFQRSDMRGVRLGPVAPDATVGPLTDFNGLTDRTKAFRQTVEVPGVSQQSAPNVQGQIAAREITSLPWDVLYRARYFQPLPQRSTAAAFDAAVRERYGVPSAVLEPAGGGIWAYEIDGRMVHLDSGSGTNASSPCVSTLRLVLAEDPLGRPTSVDLQQNAWDIGPWGCSVLMELRPNRDSDGVSGYSVNMTSGYLWAINHFYQRIDETYDLFRKVEATASREPKL